jgi:hypothetical protein
MKALSKYIGARLNRIIRLDDDESEYGNFTSLGLHLDFVECEQGISILTDNRGDELKWKSEVASGFELDKLNGFGFIHEQTLDDTLASLVGQKLKGIQFLQFDPADLNGDGFTMNRGRVQMIVIRFETNQLVVKECGDNVWTELDADIKDFESDYPDAKWETIMKNEHTTTSNRK